MVAVFVTHCAANRVFSETLGDNERVYLAVNKVVILRINPVERNAL